MYHGLCVPLTGDYGRKLSMDTIFDMLAAMQVQTVRNWMHATVLLDDPETINEEQAALQRAWISALREHGVGEILGMSHYAFLPEGVKCTDGSAVPYPDRTDGSLYMRFLADYETTWYTLAAAFPEVTLWEVGNEYNHDPFLHPINYQTKHAVFSTKEKAEITVDMLYAAKRAIGRANPSAKIVFPGMAPVDGISSMEPYLEAVYTAIESGNFGGGSTDPRMYFDYMAWHPYMENDGFSIERWIAENQTLYAVMQAHGDSDCPVYFTEFGFSDYGDATEDARQAVYFQQIYDAIATQMPYVSGSYPFRLLEDTGAAAWGGEKEVYFGMFSVKDKTHFVPKEKARAICVLYGGNPDQLTAFSE